MTADATVQCQCPGCGQICAFKATYAGRIARCLNCQQRFTIPSRSGSPAIAQEAACATPVPGFYTNAVPKGLKAFAHRDSRTGLVFCAALVLFHFLLGNEDLSVTLPGFRPPLIIGWVVTVISFGCFAWYSMEIVVNSSMDVESLPPVEPGSGFEFIWLVIKSCYLLFISLVVALLPASMISAVCESFGFHSGAVYFLFAALCLLLWPMNLAIIAMDVPWWRIFRYDLIVTAVVKSFMPYLFTALVTLAAFSIVWLGLGYFATHADLSFAAAFGLLALRVGGASLFLFSMRLIGVYLRHYSALCPDLWFTPPPQAPDVR